MKQYHLLSGVVSDSGIWNGIQKHTHAFRLSPSVYKVTQQKREELQRLGFALSDCLLGLSHIATICYDKKVNYGRKTWQICRKVFSTGVPNMYHELQGMNMRHVPKLLKVDLMVDTEGGFKIAEVDGHNKHGVGYSTLGMRFRDALYPDSKKLPGVAKALADEAKRQGYGKIKIFYADQERFYIPEFMIAKQELEKNGVECDVVSEMEAEEGFLSSGLFLDLPFLYHEHKLYGAIIGAYKRGDVKFIIPPKPCLGAKGVLAILRNDAKDAGLEALLDTFIRRRSLDTVRSYIPETVLVGTMAEGYEAVKKRAESKRYVLKESISSGMKGTIFSDDEQFDAVLTKACATRLNWILQEEVENQPQEFSWFDAEDESRVELRTSNDWFMRVTAQYVNHSLADVIITARQSKSVHGAKDCLQIGTIVV